MSRFPTIVVLLFVALCAWSTAQESLPQQSEDAVPGPPTDAKHYSYAIGLDIGSSFQKDGIKLDIDSLVSGITDGLRRAQPRYASELCDLAMQRLALEQIEQLRQRNETFIAQNRSNQGVRTTASGLQYKVLKSGPDAGRKPRADELVTVLYEGKLIDGQVFDGTGDRGPAKFVVGEVISGWIEALQMMRVGDKWRIFIPSELAYGQQGFGDVIPPHSVLIFEVELLQIERNPAAQGLPRPAARQ